MTTQYFIYNTPKQNPINYRNDDFITTIGKNINVHLLPYTNLQYYNDHGLFESNIIEWTKQFCDKNKVFLDIGSHSGTYAISLADYCQHVYAFEPQKMTYYSLCGGVALSNIQNITCVQYGLGSPSQVGKLELNIVSNDGGGSTLHPQSQNVLRKETIEIRTLDSFQLENIGFIKMDVEENEKFVLEGSVETLKRSNYPRILFESNTYNEQLFGFIKNTLGYQITKLQHAHNMYLAHKD